MYKKSLVLGFLLFTMAVGNALAFNSFRSKMLIEEAVSLTERHQFRMAYYKFRTVRIDVMDLHYSQAKNKLLTAIDTSIEKLNDPYLSGYQKINIVKDCARVAYQQINLLSSGPGHGGNGVVSVQRTLHLMNQVKQAVRNYDEFKANRLLKRIINSLRPYSFDRDIRKAVEAAQTVIEKLNDPYLYAAEKERIAADCARVFRQAVNRYLSKTTPPFGGGPGGPGGPCPF